MSGSNYDWRANRPFTPVWKTRADLKRILDRYRTWYAEGRSDVEISALLRHHYPTNQQAQFGRGKR
jgi:hypothetical protein